MRKFLFTALVLATTIANAQMGPTDPRRTTVTNTTTAPTTAYLKPVPTSNKGYKPVKGTITGEFGLSGGLLNTNLDLNNNTGLLRFRYFLKDNLAVRLGFGVSKKSDTKNLYAPVGLPISGLQGSYVTTNSGLAINLGIEKHFQGSDRLSTYAGADLLIFSNGASEKRENSNSGGTAFQQGFSGNLEGVNSISAASSGLGLRLLAGAEYYIVKNVYIGGEFAFGFQSLSKKDVTGISTTSIVNASYVITSSTSTPIDIKSPGKSSEISASVITGIRIGFQF